MKTVGLLLLFGLCTAAGLQIAAKKAERYTRICGLLQDLDTLTEAMGAGRGTLATIAEEHSGELFEQLRVYLAARGRAQREAEAAACAAESWSTYDAERRALEAFFAGLSASTIAQIGNHIDTLRRALEPMRRDAEDTAKQAKTIRALGALIGAGVCILLF